MKANHPEQIYISIEQKDQLLHYLKNYQNLNFEDYSESSVRRRITKILNELHLKDVNAYIKYLEKAENARQKFVDSFTVNVTEMFRDPFFYASLIELLQKETNDDKKFRIWSAGCSSGEETLSIAILLAESGLLDRVEILGTDLSKSIIDKARSGTYKLRHVLGYEKAYEEAGGNLSLSHYYTRNGENVKFDSDIYRSVEFKENDLTTPPPSSGFDLIICRNVLIYFNAQLQDSILNKFAEALNKDGYIALGSKESLIFFQGRHRFSEVKPESRIYKKVR